MKSLLRAMIVMVAAGSLIGFVGCKKEEGPMESLGKQVDKAAEDAKKAAKEGVKEADEAAKEAADAVKDATN